MAKNFTTYKDALTFAFGLKQYLKDTISNFRCNYWDIVSGTTNPFQVTDGKSYKSTQIGAFVTIFDAGVSVWSFTRHASNPLLAKSFNAGANHESYPTAFVKVGSDWKSLTKTDNTGWGNSSSDGISWSEDGNYLPKGGSGTFDEGKASPGCLKYLNGYYHCFYNAHSLANQLHVVGYAKTNSWGVFTKNPTAYTSSDYNAANGTSYTNLSCTDVVKVGNRFYFFGTVHSTDYLTGGICMGIGGDGGAIDAIKLDTKVFMAQDIGAGWAQYPNVWKHPTTGEWVMTVTIGRLIQNASDSNQSFYNIYSGRTDVPDFSDSKEKIYWKPIMVANNSNIWENNYVYCSSWHKDLQGNLLTENSKYLMYYSGHQKGTADYTGAMCLATIDSIPVI